MARPHWRYGLFTALLLALAPSAHALHIVFDYSYDAGGFFGAQQRRDTLQAAATVLEGLITDNLSAITPSGQNTWTATFVDPYTGQQASESNRTIAANTLLVFVGGHDLAGNEVGFGGPGGFNSFGSSAWNTTVSTRGQPNSFGVALPTDFGPWGGSISFDTLAPGGQPRNWHFGLDTAPPPGSTDFFTTALHELMHVLGFGTSGSWNTYVNLAANTYNGPLSTSRYGNAVPLQPGGDGSHWVEGLQSISTWTGLAAETAMDPTQNLGTRKGLTELELTALADIGWNLTTTRAPSAGDSNRDGKVDLIDFGTLKANFGPAYGPSRGDFNASGSVDLADFNILKANFGKSGAAAVPELGGMYLAMLAWVGFVGFRKRFVAKG